MQPPELSSDPITVALKVLMLERGLTYRALAALTQTHDPTGRGITYAYLCGLTSGREYPSRRALELIAACLNLQPRHFAEYRLGELHRQLDGRRVGFEHAWRRYCDLSADVRAATRIGFVGGPQYSMLRVSIAA